MFTYIFGYKLRHISILQVNNLQVTINNLQVTINNLQFTS